MFSVVKNCENRRSSEGNTLFNPCENDSKAPLHDVDVSVIRLGAITSSKHMGRTHDRGDGGVLKPRRVLPASNRRTASRTSRRYNADGTRLLHR